MIVYYTGTGNSRYCAELLADKLEEEVFDSFRTIQNQTQAELVSEKPWVFVSPTYCWQLPHIFEEFIRETTFHGNKDAYFVMTCGGEIGNAGAKIQKLCQEVGLHYKGVLPVVMPENYIALFEVPNAELAKRIILVAKRPLLKAARMIRQGEHFPKQKVNFIDKFKSGPLNPIFYKLFVKAKLFYATDTCIGCGKCAKACVLSNITMKNNKPAWGDKCTHCMACISSCPGEAIEYGKRSQGKPRHQCPNYVKNQSAVWK